MKNKYQVAIIYIPAFTETKSSRRGGCPNLKIKIKIVFLCCGLSPIFLLPSAGCIQISSKIASKNNFPVNSKFIFYIKKVRRLGNMSYPEGEMINICYQYVRRISQNKTHGSVELIHPEKDIRAMSFIVGVVVFIVGMPF